MYDTYVRRTVIDNLESERRASIRAKQSNGGYLQSNEGVKALKDEIDQINQHFDDVIDHIRDPDLDEKQRLAIEADPVLSAGVKGLERAKWEYLGHQEVARELAAARGS